MNRLLWILMALALAASPMPATAAAVDQNLRLRVDGDVLRDGLGREVILRGIAMINKQPPYLPDYDREDFERVRSWGLNSVRLGIGWKGIMPEGPEVDEDYVEGVGKLVDEITAAGLYVVIDMHQDRWGGDRWGNGAPEWATRTEPCPHVPFSQLTGAWQLDYFSPAVACAFLNFWISEDLQQHFMEAWQAVAARVGDNPLVAGYDLFNEPHPGLIPPGIFENSHLYPSQSRWIAAIREVAPEAIGFFEPPITKSAGIPTVPALDLPEGVVYAPHLYGAWDFDEAFWDTRRAARTSWEYSVAEAQVMGTPLWLGEFGVVADRPGADGFVADVLDLADARKAGAAYWEYETHYGPVAPDGTERVVLDGLVRAYPHAVSGTIDRIRFDREPRTLVVTWIQTEDGTSLFQVPQRLYPDGFQVLGFEDWDHDPSTGLLEVRASAGSHVILVRPGP